tara:strand:+ start:38 stop:517 length:480 start_codon:yes stop_codon:yes gene_type:complete
MATYEKFFGGSFCKGVIVKDAFVQNSTVEAEVEQPSGSILTGVYLRFLDTVPVTSATATDLGFSVGTTTGGGEIVAAITDGVLDNANDGSGTIEADSLIQLSMVARISGSTEGLTARSAAVGFASSDRVIYCQTTATDAVIATAGHVQWILTFLMVGDQ